MKLLVGWFVWVDAETRSTALQGRPRDGAELYGPSIFLGLTQLLLVPPQRHLQL